MRSQRRKFVDKKLIIRLRLFAIIFLLMTGVGIYDVVMGNLPLLVAIAALGSGIGIGLIVGRAMNVVWHEETNKAITKMDKFGVIILVCYIVFAVFRKKLFAHWLAGHQLSAFIIFLSAGIMLGRLITIRGRLFKVLKGQGV
jgi:F0F1-type ATP synthase membrane subunit c/vacuolar-type H+-ATPase subunit K